MFRTRLTTIALTAAAAATAAAPAAHAASPGLKHVCTKSTNVYVHAGKSWMGELAKGQTVKVSRYSKSGEFAFGFVRGHVNRNGWVKASDLCR